MIIDNSYILKLVYVFSYPIQSNLEIEGKHHLLIYRQANDHLSA